MVAAAGLVPGFLAAAVAVDKVRDGERDAAINGLHETVRATALVVDREVQGSLSALNALSTSEHLQTGNLAAFYDQAAAIDNRPEVWTLLLDETGKQVVSTLQPPDAEQHPSAVLERVNEALATQRPLVGDLTVTPVTRKLLTTIYVPVKGKANGRYVLAQSFSVDFWKKAALQPAAQSAWIVAIIDRNGKFIARTKMTDSLLGESARTELVAAAASANEGMIRHTTLENIDAYDAFTHSELTGWTIAVAAPVKTIEGSAWRAVLWLIFGVGSALAVAAASAFLLGRRLIRDIQAAANSALEVGKGNLPVATPTTLLEIGALNSSLSVAGSLLAQERASREAAEQERERLLENETMARLTAEQHNVAKDQFLALLGHELRNPLAGISGASTILLRQSSNEVARQRYLAIIERQSRNLSRILDDFLDINRASSGKISLALIDLDLADCVRESVEAMRTTMGLHEHNLIVETEPAWVRADPFRIEQIVNNLVANALKFSPPGSDVVVRVRSTDSHAIITVTDAGIGIDSALLRRIFEPFVQGPSQPSMLSSGLGIGLALAHQLVALHAGSITARSDGEGLGSTFQVTLPVMDAPIRSQQTDRSVG